MAALIMLTGILLFGIMVAWIVYLFITVKNYLSTYNIMKVSEKIREFPLVSVILPTRNEAERIEDCIKSLKSQTYPNFEVIIVDDSTDDTVETIKHLVGKDNRFKIVKQPPLSPGWIGKSHAMQKGSEIAKGKWLLMLDADVKLHPDIIMKAVSYAEDKKLDMISLIPHLVCKSFWEKIIQPAVGGLALFVSPPFLVNNDRSKAGLAMGAFILIRKEAFEKVGGYKKIKDRITDDVEMARLMKREGFKVRLLNGQRAMHVRMYRNLKEIWMGWSKNLFPGLAYLWNIKSRIPLFLIALLGSIAIFLFLSYPTLMLSFVVAWLLLHKNLSRDLLYLSVSVWLISMAVQLVGHFLFRGQPKYALLTFIGGIVVSLIFLNSGIRVLFKKGVTWKGRAYYANQNTN